MAYRSPFHFLPYTASFPVDPLVIQRAKKKLLAEFELSDQTADGFSKNDLLQWFDNLKQEELQYHKFIYDQKVLLRFLEEGTVSTDAWSATFPHDNAPLQKFVFELVQKQYDSLFTEAFRNHDIERIKELSRFPLPELEKKGRYYYSGALNLLTSYYHQFLQLIKDWNGSRETEMREFMALPFFKVIPHLPNYFQAMRDEFAVTLARFAESQVENSSQQNLARDILKLCGSLHASPAARATIDNIRKEKVEVNQQEKSTQPAKKGRGCLMWIILVIVIMNLIRLVLSAIA